MDNVFIGKKIVFAANTSWYLYNFRKSSIEKFISLGCEVVCVFDDDSYRSQIESLGAKVYSLKMDRAVLNPLSEVATFWGFVLAYYSLRPNVVLNFTPRPNIYSTIVAKALGINVISNVSGRGLGYASGIVVRVAMDFLNRISFRLNDFIYFQNPDDMKDFSVRFKLNDEFVRLAPGSGVDLQRFHSQVKVKGPRTVFGFFSRLIVAKGAAVFAGAAEALQQFDGLEFVMGGSIESDRSDAISEMEVSSWSNLINFRYLGFVDDIVEVLRCCDCVVLPSFYPEGTPRILIEALACGVPVITTDMPGCRDTVLDGVNGYLIRPNSVDSLVEAMLKFTELSCVARHNMSIASRELARDRFDEAVVIDSYVNDVRRILSSASK